MTNAEHMANNYLNFNVWFKLAPNSVIEVVSSEHIKPFRTTKSLYSFDSRGKNPVDVYLRWLDQTWDGQDVQWEDSNELQTEE